MRFKTKIILSKNEIDQILKHQTVERNGIILARAPKLKCRDCLYNRHIVPCISCIDYSKYYEREERS